MRQLAKRYADNPLVIGFDLRNEIRKTPSLSASWGDNNILTDWKRAAILGSNEVLKSNPQMLVFVGGINYQLDLTDVRMSPIGCLISDPNKLIYTGHFYGFSWVFPTYFPSWKLWTY